MPQRYISRAIDLRPEAHLETEALTDSAEIDSYLEPFLVSTNANQSRIPAALALRIDS